MPFSILNILLLPFHINITSQVVRITVCFIVTGLIWSFILPSSVFAVFTDTGGGDHEGADWTISVNTNIAGVHTNIGTFTVNSGVTATVQPYNGSTFGSLEISATTVDIQGTLTGSGSGFGSTTGSGEGSNGTSTNGGGGGGYGGTGGNGETGIAGGTFYGSVTAPVSLGSGGGVSHATFGGAGGGAVILNVTGTTTIAGSITANGAVGGTTDVNSGGGGGSGGSVSITTGTLAGAGSISANGGNGGDQVNADGGGGGGGRVALYYTTRTHNGTVQASGGTGPGSATDGAAGTLFEKPSAQTDGNLTIDNLGKNIETATTQLPAGSYNVDTFNITAGTYFLIQDGVTITVSNSFNPTGNYFLSNTSSTGTMTYPTLDLTTTGTVTIIGGGAKWPLRDITVSSGTLNLNGSYSVRNVVIETGAVLTHQSNTTAQTYDLQLTASGDLTINGTGSINVNAKGYSSSNGPGQGTDGGSTIGGGGGGYGGTGGNGETGIVGGTFYGSVTAPVSLGSGGGLSWATNGGAGGGAVILNVTGTTTIAGSITANGAVGGTTDVNSGGGGGSGGTVSITTGTLAGAGSISANGGNGGDQTNADGGGGSGGRVALLYTTKTHNGTVQAAGGTGPGSATDGAAGTMYEKPSAQTDGNLTLDNLGKNTETATQLPAGSYSINILNITGNTYFVIQDGVAIGVTNVFNPTGSYFLSNTSSTGTISYPTLDLTTTETATIIGGETKWPLRDITISSGTLSLNGSYSVRDVVIETGAVLTHQSNTTAQTYDLQLTASGNLTINGTGSINVNAKGYSSSNGLGQGTDSVLNTGSGGGGYGGAGGAGKTAIAGGGIYGSVTAPVDLGSGGGQASGSLGGAGGGAVILNVTGTTTIAGSITANGSDGAINGGAQTAAGGGSGGTVSITTGTLAGAGSISANGGNGGDGVFADAGGGGGGRIALFYSVSTYTGSKLATGGVGPDAATDGANGTVVYSGIPTTSTPFDISQATNASGYVSFKTTLSHGSGLDTNLKVEYSDDNGLNWYDPFLASATPNTGSTDLNNSDPYQIGSTDGIDTSSGSVILTVEWDTKNAANANGSMDGIDNSQLLIRLTPNDSSIDGSQIISANFEVDNLNPSTATISANAFVSNTIQLNWAAVTEANFNYYEIWYGTTQSDVESRSGTALKWSTLNDAALATRTTSTTTITGFSEGIYYFKMWAVDNFNNEAGTNTISETFDVTPALITLIPLAPDSTADTTPTITGTASDTVSSIDSVEFQIDGTTGSWTACTADDAAFDETSEEFSCSVISALSDGSHTLYVRATDSENNTNTDGSYGTDLFVIDTISPTVPGTPSTTTPTSDTTPTWTWTASTDAESGLATPAYTVQWSEDLSFVSGVSSDTSNVNSYTHSIVLAEGTWYFRVKATDTASNESSFSSNGSVVVDETAPGSPGTPSTTTPTNSTSQDWNWTAATDVLSGISSYAWRVIDDASTAISDGTTVATSVVTNLTEGIYTFFVKAIDNAGNSGSESSGSVTVSTAAPQPSEPPAAPELDSPGNNNYISSDRPTFTWKSAADTAGLSYYVLEIDNGESGDFTISDIPVSQTTDIETNRYVIDYENFDDSDSTNNYISVHTRSSSDWGADHHDGKLKEGRRSWKVKVRDTSGNESSSSRELFVDRSGPDLHITQINATPFSSNNFSTTDTTPTIFGTVTDMLSGETSSAVEHVIQNNEVASGPTSVVVTLEKRNADGTYTLDTITTVKLNEMYWTSNGRKVPDNSYQTSNKYSPFEFTPSMPLTLGTYNLTITGKDTAGNTGGEVVFTLTIGTVTQIATPQEQQAVEEEIETELPNVTSQQKEEIKQDVEITKPEEPVTVSETPRPNPFTSITRFFSNLIAYIAQVGEQGWLAFVASTEQPVQFIANLREWIFYSTTSFEEIVLDNKPTQISNVQVTVLTPTSAIITWKTNHLATSKVNYGITKDYGKDVQSSKKVHNHRLIISGLEPSTTYQYEVMSQNKNYVYDANHEFVTPGE